MSKNKMRFYIALAALLAAFCAVSFAVPFVKNTVYWLGFAFAVLAILIQFYAMPKAMEGSARSKFYGFPVLRVAFIYLVLQLILSLVFMAAAQWLPAWIPVLVFVLLLCAALVGFVAAEGVREELNRQDTGTKKQLSAMLTLRAQAASLAERCATGEAKKALSALAEELRFSDPVSSDSTADAEAELARFVNELRRAVDEGREPDAPPLCRKASALLAERNRLCKLSK